MIYKLIVGLVAAAIWVGLVILKHFWPDLEIGAIVSACGMVLAGLGAYHMGGGGDVGQVVTGTLSPFAAPVDKGQGGFARVQLLVIVAAIALGMSLLAGCASLTEAGHTGYSIEPAAAGGCKFGATDGKEFSARSLAMTSSAQGCQMLVNEGASSAFQGQAIAGKALSVLPSFAAPILEPGPAIVVPQMLQPLPAVAPASASGKSL